MSALPVSKPGSRGGDFLVVLVDDSGPLGSMNVGPEWRDRDLCEFAYAFAALDVDSKYWAPNPDDYTPMQTDVLLVHKPGTHEVSKRASHRKSKAHRSGMDLLARGASKSAVARSFIDDPEDRNIGFLDANEKRRETQRNRRQPAPAMPELDDVEVVNMCSCGCAYTLKTFHALPFSGTGTKVFRDGSKLVTETYRNCVCGSTRMIFTEREVAE